MRTTSSFQFYCRESKKNKQGLAPVELSIIINGSRKFINLPVKFQPAEFNKKRPSMDIVETESLWRSKITLYMADMMKNDIPLTAEGLRSVIQTGGVKSYTIEDLFKEYMKILEKRIDVDLTFGVYRKYELVKNLFFETIDKTKECNEITNAVILEFYAEIKKRYVPSTCSGYMTKLKAFVKFGMNNGKIAVNPFQGVKVKKGQKPITYLTEEEVMKIVNTRFENESLQNVADCFIVMCGTGLAYADLKNLKREDLQEDNGTYFIKKNRVKTNKEFLSVVTPWAVDIIQNKELKVLTNQKINCYLKVIGTIVGLEKNLHCHLARHTYATLLLNKYHIPISTIQRTLGHSSVQMTSSFYARLLDNTVIDEIGKAF